MPAASGLMTVLGFATCLRTSAQQDLRLRFFNFDQGILVRVHRRLTHLDYARAMAFVAIDEASDATLGVVRLHTASSGAAGEVRDPAEIGSQGQRPGLGRDAADHRVCHIPGPQAHYRPDCPENSVMLKMCRQLGFRLLSTAGSWRVRCHARTPRSVTRATAQPRRRLPCSCAQRIGEPAIRQITSSSGARKPIWRQGASGRHDDRDGLPLAG